LCAGFRIFRGDRPPRRSAARSAAGALRRASAAPTGAQAGRYEHKEAGASAVKVTHYAATIVATLPATHYRARMLPSPMRIPVAVCAVLVVTWTGGCGGGGHKSNGGSNTLCAQCSVNDDAVDRCIDGCDETCDSDEACAACEDGCDGCGKTGGLACVACSDNCAPNATKRCAPMDDVTQCQDGVY